MHRAAKGQPGQKRCCRPCSMQVQYIALNPRAADNHITSNVCRKRCTQRYVRTSLLSQGVDDDLINTPLGGRAKGQRERQQGIQLLVLLQDLVVLRAALVLLLDPARVTLFLTWIPSNQTTSFSSPGLGSTKLLKTKYTLAIRGWRVRLCHSERREAPLKRHSLAYHARARRLASRATSW